VSEKIQPIREPGSLAAVTVEQRAVRKKLGRIIEHINATGALAGKENELRAALADFRTTTAQLRAALTRIIDA